MMTLLLTSSHWRATKDMTTGVGKNNLGEGWLGGCTDKETAMFLQSGIEINVNATWDGKQQQNDTIYHLFWALPVLSSSKMGQWHIADQKCATYCLCQWAPTICAAAIDGNTHECTFSSSPYLQSIQFNGKLSIHLSICFLYLSMHPSNHASSEPSLRTFTQAFGDRAMRSFPPFPAYLWNVALSYFSIA